MSFTRRKVLGAAGAVALASAIPGKRVFAQQNTVKIGMSMPQTGSLGAGGQAALVALRMWVDEVNVRGGLLNKRVEFIVYDDQTNPANVPGIYTKLLDVDKVDIVASDYGTNLIAPAMPIVSSDLPHVVPLIDVPSDREASMSVNDMISVLPLFQLQRPNRPMSSVTDCSTLKT